MLILGIFENITHYDICDLFNVLSSFTFTCTTVVTQGPISLLLVLNIISQDNIILLTFWEFKMGNWKTVCLYFQKDPNKDGKKSLKFTRKSILEVNMKKCSL